MAKRHLGTIISDPDFTQKSDGSSKHDGRGGSMAEWLRHKTPMRAARNRLPVLVACTIKQFIMLGEQTMCAKICNAAELE